MKTNQLSSRLRPIPLIKTLGVVFLALGVIGLAAISAQTPPKDDQWKSYRFLLGKWESAPDSSDVVGGTTFSLELQNNILIRKNFAKYPAANGKPAINHEDLMVLFQQPGNPVEANYWDNEGHFIHYLAKFSDNADTLSLTSDVSPGRPRFRLTYFEPAMDTLKVNFEFAPPGQPDGFQPYLSGMLHRKQ